MSKCCAKPLSEKRIQDILLENGFRRTKAKIQILHSITKSKAPISVAELYEVLGKNGCDVSTIFRTVVTFKEKGIIREVNLGEDFARFEFIHNNHHHHHHHHVRCRQCGEIKSLEKCDISAFEKAIHQLGFKSTEHFLEFTGICAKCA